MNYYASRFSEQFFTWISSVISLALSSWNGNIQVFWLILMYFFRNFHWTQTSYFYSMHTISTLLKGRRSIKLYSTLRVFQWQYIRIFPIFASKRPKKWTFKAKKWHLIRILSKWLSNQEWPFICADTVCNLILFSIHSWEIQCWGNSLVRIITVEDYPSTMRPFSFTISNGICNMLSINPQNGCWVLFTILRNSQNRGSL